MVLTLTDIFLAYRQAKNAVFAERRGAGLEDFAKYEAKLEDRLRLLLGRDPGSTWFDRISLGTVWLSPKAVRVDAPPEDTGVHHIGSEVHDGTGALDVRVVVTPSVDFHVVEILYLWRFGPVLDALLRPASVGYRLKQRNYEDDESRCQQHVFEFWPKKYKAFRSDAMDEARRLLKSSPERSCVIASLDLRSCYDSVAPEFLLSDEFVRQLDQVAHSRSQEFDADEYAVATRSLLGILRKYHAQAASLIGMPVVRGVPIGALTSRVIANVALASLDERIAHAEDVVCYRRYVDDLILVAKGDVDEGLRKEEVFGRWLPFSSVVDGTTDMLDEVALQRPNSTLRINLAKSRVYVLRGIEGQDLLDAVEADVGRLASEQRSFLDTTILRKRTLTEVLNAAGPHQSTLHVLREDDREHLANWGMSVALRSLERIADLVDREGARAYVHKRLQPIIRALVRTDDWVKRMEVALRVLRLAVRVEDAESVEGLLIATEQVWGLGLAARELYWDGQPVVGKGAVGALRRYLQQRLLEAICAALPVGRRAALPRLTLRAHDRILSHRSIARLANQFGAADLRSRDREEEHVHAGSRRRENDHSSMQSALIEEGRLGQRFEDIGLFASACERAREPAWCVAPLNLFLSVRPPQYFDVARQLLALSEHEGYLPDAFAQVERVVNAIRGTRYFQPIGNVIAPDHIAVHSNAEEPAARLILGNVSLDESWHGGTVKSPPVPVLSLERARGLGRVLERARVVARYRPPDGGATAPPALLALPELSVPRQWLRPVANHVVKTAPYSLVMGLEYRHDAGNAWVYNQVLGVFVGRYGAVVPVVWTKQYPAAPEIAHLGKYQFAPLAVGARRTVVTSQYGALSVLICSELIEARRVSDLVGRIELLLVPSWNTDTATYEHLMQSAGFQAHTIIGIVNNGNFSDCRAWAPLEKRPLRELCRLIHRDSDDVVWADVPVASLRKFHHGAPDASWRPLPPGWKKGP